MHIPDLKGQKKKERIERLASIGAVMIILSFAVIFLIALVDGPLQKRAVVFASIALMVLGGSLYFIGHRLKWYVKVGEVASYESQSPSAPHPISTFRSTELPKHLHQGMSNLSTIGAVSCFLALVLTVLIVVYLVTSNFAFSFGNRNLMLGIVVAISSSFVAFTATTGVTRYSKLIRLEKETSEHIAVTEHGLKIFVGIIAGTGLFGGKEIKHPMLSIPWDQISSFEVRGQYGADKNKIIPFWRIAVNGHSEPIRIERRLIGTNEKTLISAISEHLKQPIILKDELSG